MRRFHYLAALAPETGWFDPLQTFAEISALVGSGYTRTN